MNSKMIEAAEAAITAVNEMSDEELIAALEGADTTLAYAFNPEMFINAEDKIGVPKQVCDHDLKFLGPSVGKTDLYVCTKCNEQISKRYYEWHR